MLSGGAFTIESEYSRYNRLGGYNANYAKSEGRIRAGILPDSETGRHRQVRDPRQVRQGGVYRWDCRTGVQNPNYRQNTTEVNFDYIIKQFDARVMSFYKDTRFNACTEQFLGGGHRPAVPDLQGYSLVTLKEEPMKR